MRPRDRLVVTMRVDDVVAGANGSKVIVDDEKPEWAGKSGPGPAYELDEEGELVWFASASSMGYGPTREEPQPEQPRQEEPAAD